MIEKYFLLDGSEPFVLFSFTHLLTLSSLVLIVMFIYFLRKPIKTPMLNCFFRYSLAGVLLLSEVSLHLWLWKYEVWDIRYSLPFHLSSISLVLSALLLITKSYRLFEFTFFAGVGSALQAMITPDISDYTFPHYRYVHFFISHGGIVVANMFFVLVEKYKPTFSSIWKAFLYLNIYTIFVLLLNFSLNANYMYISRKPVNPSIIDYLGPWPFYIISLELIALITFAFLYMPFGLWKLVNKASQKE